MKKAIKTKLLSIPELTAFIGSRVHELPVPRNYPKPFVVIRRKLHIRFRNLVDGYNVCRERWFFDIHTETDHQAEQIKCVIDDAIGHTVREKWGDIFVYSAILQDVEDDMSDFLKLDDDISYAVKELEFSIVRSL